MEENKSVFTWNHILLHIGIIITISIVVTLVISKDVCASASDYISGVGSATSVYAIAITLWQLRQVKRVAQAAKDAALKKSEEIDSFVTYANIERHSEMCDSIVSCVSAGQFEAAAMKIDNIRKLLIEIREKSLPYVDKRGINKLISDTGNDVVNLRSRWMSNTDLDTRVVVKHISKVKTELSDISTNFKRDRI